MELFIGRSLAMVVHPIAAWYSVSNKKRTLLVGGYVAIGYAAGCGVLLAGLF